MSNAGLSEKEMRSALGLDRPIQAPPVPSQNRPRRYTLVVLSVRKKAGGLPFRLEHQSSSISTLTAQMEAEQLARKQNLNVWAVLDIRQVDE